MTRVFGCYHSFGASVSSLRPKSQPSSPLSSAASIQHTTGSGKNRKVLSVSDDPEAAQEPLTSRDSELGES
jgi:hypothetical protein